MEIVLEAKEVSKRFGGQTAVDRVSLQVRARQIVTLIGPNGAGKSVLLRLLLGLERPDSGEITRKPGLHIGYMPQKLPLDAVLPLSADRFLRMHAHHRPTEAEIEAICAEVGVSHLRNRQLRDVSSGELQRLMLARALLCEPEILVLDEPVQGVDVSGQAQLYALISRISRARGLAVLMVSHDLHFVMSATDEVICLHHHVCCAGHPEAVRENPAFPPAFAAQMALYTHRHNHSHD